MKDAVEILKAVRENITKEILMVMNIIIMSPRTRWCFPTLIK